MKKISRYDDMLDDRESLRAWLNERAVSELFLLTDKPTGPEEDRAGKRTPIFLAKSEKGERHTYLVLSKPKARGKEDSFLVWLADDVLGTEVKPDTDSRYLVIDKSRLGRPRRETSEEERQEILERRKLGQTINHIAEVMKIGTRRVSDVTREAEGGRADGKPDD